MKRKYAALILSAALVLCVSGALLLRGRPALLENEELPGITIEDEDVPLAGAPGEAADWTEGLDGTQIASVNAILEQVNAARAAAGLAALELDPVLCKAAQVRAAECEISFSHTRPDGTKYKTAITDAGISSGYTGENVATGYTTADQAMAGWLKSEGHRANILNERFTKIGIASKKNNNQYGGYTWEQLFIS